jgi:hypothetical protein
MAVVTRLLQAIEEGDGSAAEALLPLVHEDLQRLAASRMAAESPGQILQPTALLNDGRQAEWKGRGTRSPGES